MKDDVVRAGFYLSPRRNRDYPQLQMFTSDDLLHGAEVKMPPSAMTFKQDSKADEGGEQRGLGI